jgi:dTDP-glucose 4,6-dehydratase
LRLQERYTFRLVHFSSSEVYGDYPNLMLESVMDEYGIRQMNDYAMTKWVNEMQIRNSAVQYGTESVVVRIFNTYGPGEYYSPYRSVNCRFIYCALKGVPFVVYRGYSRTSTYLSDSVRTLANIMNNFKPGEVYNICGDTYHTIEEFADLVLKVTNASKSLVQYRDSEVLTTREKKVDNSKSIRDLDHKTTVSLEEGIRRTAAWMRSVYGIG